jgi:hypothetical protein
MALAAGIRSGVMEISRRTLAAARPGAILLVGPARLTAGIVKFASAGCLGKRQQVPGSYDDAVRETIAMTPQWR